MRSNRVTSSFVLRMCCAIALFWTVGCKSDGARADESTESKAPVTSAQKPAPVQATESTPAKPVAAGDIRKAPASQDKKKAPNFKVTITSPTLSVGGKGTASVSIAALAGYKWNKEYPAKLVFKTPPKNVKFGKMEFKQMAKPSDFKVGDKKTDVVASMMASAAGTETVKGALKFSICNETACIIEKAEVALAVSVQP